MAAKVKESRSGRFIKVLFEMRSARKNFGVMDFKCECEETPSCANSLRTEYA